MNIFKTAVGRLRVISLLDACSYLYLLYCAIYLKRICGDASAIKIPGMVHGALFTTFCLFLLHAMIAKRWSVSTTILIGLTSIVPFLPFWLETWLKKQDR